MKCTYITYLHLHWCTAVTRIHLQNSSSYKTENLNTLIVWRVDGVAQLIKALAPKSDDQNSVPPIYMVEGKGLTPESSSLASELIYVCAYTNKYIHTCN